MKIKYMCPICFELYGKKKTNENDMACPECGTGLVDIDGPIAKDIVKLNRKGYITEYCCAGHYEKEHESCSDFYVSFMPVRDAIIPWLLRHVPDGMEIEVYDNGWEGDHYPKYICRLGPRMNVYDDAITMSKDGESSYISKKNHKKYQAWRDEIAQFTFHKWVKFLPNLYRKSNKSK